MYVFIVVGVLVYDFKFVLGVVDFVKVGVVFVFVV